MPDTQIELRVYPGQNRIPHKSSSPSVNILLGRKGRLNKKQNKLRKEGWGQVDDR